MCKCTCHSRHTTHCAWFTKEMFQAMKEAAKHHDVMVRDTTSDVCCYRSPNMVYLEVTSTGDTGAFYREAERLRDNRYCGVPTHCCCTCHKCGCK